MVGKTDYKGYGLMQVKAAFKLGVHSALRIF
jgi:hypothetical protein